MPKVSAEHMEQRKQQVLQAATQCFAEKGFHACTMQDICQLSGMSPGAVYRYFPSKESIIQNMSEQERQRNEFIFEEMRKQEDVRLVLNGLIDAFFDQFQQKESLMCAKLGVMLLTESINNQSVKKLMQRNTQQIIQSLLEIVEQGKRNGQLKKGLDAKSFVQALFALHQGLVAQIAQGQQIDVKSYKKILQQFVSSAYVTLVMSISLAFYL